MTWHDTTWHDMRQHDMTPCEMTWHCMTWHDMALHDVTWHCVGSSRFRHITLHYAASHHARRVALYCIPKQLLKTMPCKCHAYVNAKPPHTRRTKPQKKARPCQTNTHVYLKIQTVAFVLFWPAKPCLVFRVFLGRSSEVCEASCSSWAVGSGPGDSSEHCSACVDTYWNVSCIHIVHSM